MNLPRRPRLGLLHLAISLLGLDGREVVGPMCIRTREDDDNEPPLPVTVTPAPICGWQFSRDQEGNMRGFINGKEVPVKVVTADEHPKLPPTLEQPTTVVFPKYVPPALPTKHRLPKTKYRRLRGQRKEEILTRRKRERQNKKRGRR